MGPKAIFFTLSVVSVLAALYSWYTYGQDGLGTTDYLDGQWRQLLMASGFFLGLFVIAHFAERFWTFSNKVTEKQARKRRAEIERQRRTIQMKQRRRELSRQRQTERKSE